LNKAEKEEIITKVTSLLKEIPSSMDIVKKAGNRHKRFEYLATHMVEKAIEKDALIISKNRMGIAILFKTSKKDDNFLKDIRSQIGLVLNVTGVKNAYTIVKNQNYIKKQRPQESENLYCWFWGILAESRGADTQVGKEMKDEFYRKAKEFQIPLYAETRMRKNALVYQRFGFELFHEWQHPSGDTMYFLRYNPPPHSENQ
jgi:rRNA processing protein Gar1